jgi:hypothetical protein
MFCVPVGEFLRIPGPEEDPAYSCYPLHDLQPSALSNKIARYSIIRLPRKNVIIKPPDSPTRRNSSQPS